ncbi:LVIVD repeat-containing protein [Haloactinopolyspora alba]|uniref:LVIVD repeat-containing protein n=1 Tax=Haloactinopolyspora alba TaxID=648780 RepID=A0A2P8E9K8_9ACTN|nr:hypothetical protein [Haloactinopolyspora alba]PSL06135.1 LVIVD repeat-containing protein [Haloactinopolyspora alba]
MRKRFSWVIAPIAVVALSVGALSAGADHGSRESTQNLHAMGHSPHPASFDVPSAEREVNSDIAFWGDIAFHGNYDGFRIVDVSAPGNPKLINHQRCTGDQGDIFVWEDILVRSWNSPAPAGRFCDGQPVPVGFEGLHVFDISDFADPELIGSVELDCGSHTQTGTLDDENDRLIIYSNVSSGCTKDGVELGDAIDVVEVPLEAPENAQVVNQVPLMGGTLGSNNGCHDAGLIEGDVNLLACASGHAANVFSVGPPHGGTLEEPLFRYTIEETDEFGNQVGVGGRWHSAGFSWDGDVIVLGWEPGGGGQAECEADDPDIKKSMFFYDADDGAKLGQWVLPRAQGPDENCTIHNYNAVPLRDGRDVVVAGNYQAGTWAVDFTDPANAVAVAWSDPASLGPGPFCSQTSPPGCQLGGAWSSYWYNKLIFESDITRGLNVFRLSDKVTAKSIKLDHLNPQTQEFSLP